MSARCCFFIIQTIWWYRFSDKFLICWKIWNCFFYFHQISTFVVWKWRNFSAKQCWIKNECLCANGNEDARVHTHKPDMNERCLWLGLIYGNERVREWESERLKMTRTIRTRIITMASDAYALRHWVDSDWKWNRARVSELAIDTRRAYTIDHCQCVLHLAEFYYLFFFCLTMGPTIASDGAD